MRALRVPAPPSAKLNLLISHICPPFICSLRGALLLGGSNSACVSSSQPANQLGEHSKMLLPKAQCNCPVIVHSSTAQRVGVQRAVSTLHTRYRNLTVSLVLNCAYTAVDRQRGGSGGERSEIGVHA